jgi:ribosome-dependent ATPase
MEDAIKDAAARAKSKGQGTAADVPVATDQPAALKATVKPAGFRLKLIRMMAYARNETVQILRDPVRLIFSFLGSSLLMLVFGFGITTDIEHIRYASFDLDQSPESRAYLEQFEATKRYFTRTPPVRSADEGLHRLQADNISVLLEVPPNFGRDLRRKSQPEVLAQVDAAMTFRGETVAQYVQGVNDTMLKDPANGLQMSPPVYTAKFQERYMYNPTFESVYSIVPSVPALLLVLIPAILMAVSIVREKELGSMINFYVTPTGRLEYLLGKQLPYIAIAMLNFFILATMALIIFGVSIKGSFLMLTFVTLLYVTATTGIGMVISTFTGSQVAAVFVTAILTMTPTIQFSGFLQPVSTLMGKAQLIGSIWPTTYYMHSSVGAYTKGLASALMMQDIVFLLCCIPVLWAFSMLGLRKQEK